MCCDNPIKITTSRVFQSLHTHAHTHTDINSAPHRDLYDSYTLYVKMPNVTAGYGRFTDSIEPFENFHFNIIITSSNFY